MTQLTQEEKDKLTMDFRELQIINISHNGTMLKSYLMNERSHNSVSTWWLSQLDTILTQKIKEAFEEGRKKERGEIVKIADFDIEYYQSNEVRDKIIYLINSRND